MQNTELASLILSGNVARLVLKRPPLNFLNLELLRQVEDQLESLPDSPPFRMLTLESEGAAFSAGLEVSERTRETIFLLLEQFHRVVHKLNSFPRPTVAIVRGMALGAGNELVACCDFAFAAENASFGQPEINVGSIPSLAPLLLPPLVGQRRAVQLILTGELISAQEAARIGLVHRAMPEDQLPRAVEDLLRKLEGMSLAVIELALQAMRWARIEQVQDHLRQAESLYLNELMELEDPVEGVEAFLEKRPPRWKNR